MQIEWTNREEFVTTGAGRTGDPNPKAVVSPQGRVVLNKAATIEAEKILGQSPLKALRIGYAKDARVIVLVAAQEDQKGVYPVRYGKDVKQAAIAAGGFLKSNKGPQLNYTETNGAVLGVKFQAANKKEPAMALIEVPDVLPKRQLISRPRKAKTATAGANGHQEAPPSTASDFAE